MTLSYVSRGARVKLYTVKSLCVVQSMHIRCKSLILQTLQSICKVSVVKVLAEHKTKRIQLKNMKHSKHY
jgi:hypothetical protein